MRLLRMMLFAAAFTTEVTVHAEEVVFLNVKSKVDVQCGQRNIQVRDQTKTPLPCTMETSKKSALKLHWNYLSVAADKQTLFEMKDPSSLVVFRGVIWIESSLRQPPPVVIEVPQGKVIVMGAALLRVSNEKTVVDSLSGDARIIERVTPSQELSFGAGYSAWIGGRSLQGHHVMSLPESSDWHQIIETWAHVSQLPASGFRGKLEIYRQAWKQAVVDSAQSIKQRIDAERETERAHQAGERRRQQAAASERAQLRKMFRSKALGAPDENTEFPSESERSPANAPQSDDTERSGTAE